MKLIQYFKDCYTIYKLKLIIKYLIKSIKQDIKDNTFDLNDFKKSETFLPYDKLQEKLRWVTFADAVNTPAVQVASVASVVAAQTEQTELNANVQTTTVQPVTEAPAAKEQSLDDMLAGLI